MTGSITTATLVARLQADVTGFVSGMSAAASAMTASTAKMQAIGKEAAATGKSMTTHISLPLVAIGVLAIHSAMKFEEGMTKIATLTTATTHEVEAMGDAMMKFGQETGQSPLKLQQAMFLLASSGLDAKSAIDALHMSAQAAALGLGDAGTVADAVSSAMNAYGPSVLSARDATNALINAVKLGKMKPEELAGSLGKVIPMARAMGVSFQEVVGDMASLTQVGMSSNIASTALRATLMAIAHPTTDAATAFAKLGLSVEDVQNKVKSQGLLPTLQELSARVDGNAASMTKMFPEARALAGIFAWTGSNAANSARNFEELRKNTDQLSKGMDYLAKQPGFQVKQAMTSLQTSVMKFGDTILPVAAQVAGAFGAIFHAIGSLPQPVLMVIAAFATFAATIGPIAFGIGKLVEAMAVLRTAFQMMSAFGAEAVTLVNPIMLIAVAVGAVVTAFAFLHKSTQENKTEIDALTQSYEKNAHAIDKTAQATLYKTIQDKHQDDDLKRVQKSLGDNVRVWDVWTNAVNGSEAAARRLRQAMLDSGEVQYAHANGTKVSREELERWLRTGKLVENGNDTLRTKVFGNVGVLNTLAAQIGSARAAHDELRNAQANGATAAGAFGAAATTAAAGADAVDTSVLGLGSATNSAGRTIDDMRSAMDGATQAGKDLKDAYDAIFGASMSMVEAEIAARGNVEALKKSFEDAHATTDDHTSALLRTFRGYEELASATATQTHDTKAATDAFEMNTAAMILTAKKAGATQQNFIDLARAMNLPESIITQVSTPGADAAAIILANLKTISDQIPKVIDQTAHVRVKFEMATQGITISDGKGGTQVIGVHLVGGNTNLTAAGGVFTKRSERVVAEAGPEAVVPLGNTPVARKNRDRVLAAAGLGATTSSPRATRPAIGSRSAAGAASLAQASGGTTTIMQHFTVELAVPASAPDPTRYAQTMVDALVAWTRQNGALPVKVQS